MSVVAISADDVWAVGWTGGNSGPITLIEHWNGSTWSVVPSPNPSATDNHLWGVTALATNNVWAVGDFNATGGAISGPCSCSGMARLGCKSRAMTPVPLALDSQLRQ
jgi:hypothetical protein